MATVSIKDWSLPDVVPLPKLSTPKSTQTTKDIDMTEYENVQVDNAKNDDEDESDFEMIGDEDMDVDRSVDDTKNAIKKLDITSNSPAAPAPAPVPALEATTSTAAAASEPQNPFVNAMLGHAQGNLTLTENAAITFKSTLDERLDFFFEVMQNTSPQIVLQHVENSWSRYPLDTLKMIFQLRSIRHGKGARDVFYTCMEFLREKHPKTLLYNLRFIPDHGYWKDLLNWLVFETRGGRSLTDIKKFSLISRPKINPANFRKVKRGKVGKIDPKTGQKLTRPPEKVKTEQQRLENIQKAEERNRQHSLEAREKRHQVRDSRFSKARNLFETDEGYRSLHIEIARLFANALARDINSLKQGKPVSLVGKWCPTLDQFHDKHTLICTTIAQILYPVMLENETKVQYIYRIRQNLRKEYYVPLRKAVPVLETKMAANQWDEIPYNRVPSVAMKKNKHLFEEKDKERFDAYLKAVEKGETTVAAAALLPHEIVNEARKLEHLPEDDLKVRTIEAQWNSYIERLKKAGTFTACMAMCDVSGSMSGIPMEVSIALSLLLARLTEPPFSKLILTFDGSPAFHHVKDERLSSQARKLQCSDWGMSTDIQKAFDLILNIAIQHKVPKEDMVKTLFIFSDMEFNSAVANSTVTIPGGLPFTNYNVAKQKFENAGYEVPKIVFWNLRSSELGGNKPVLKSQPGVAMVSGYSGMLVKLFLDGADLEKEISPIAIMEKAIHAKEFRKLKVID